MSSILRVLHTTTWDYFTSHLPDRFSRSPQAVKEEIMMDINDLVQDFWRTSSDVGPRPSFFAMRRMLEILQECLKVCFDVISVFAAPVDLADIYRLGCRQTQAGNIPPGIGIPPTLTTTKSEPNLTYCLMGIKRCLIGHFLNPTIWVICSGSYLVSECKMI